MQDAAFFLYIISFASGWSGLALMLNGWNESRKKAALFFILLLAGMLCIQGELLLSLFIHLYIKTPSAFYTALKSILDIIGSTLIIAAFPRAFLFSTGRQENKVEGRALTAIPALSLILGIIFHISSIQITAILLTAVLYATIIYTLVSAFKAFSKMGSSRVKRFFRVLGLTSLAFIPLLVFEHIRPHMPMLKNMVELEFFALPLFFMVINIEVSILGYPFLKEHSFKGEVSEKFILEYGITKRESEIIPLFVDGKTYAEIADILSISPRTVDKHIENIYAKTLVSNRLQLLHLLSEGI